MLQSFSFKAFHGYNELPDNVLSLFIGLVENPEKRVEFSSEIVSAGLQGNISFDKPFNIDAYESTIRKNQSLTASKKGRRELFIDSTSSSDDYEEIASKGGVREDMIKPAVTCRIKDEYENLLLDDELSYAISTIKELQPILKIEERVDILKTIELALRGIPNAVELIKRICNDYEIVAKQVEIILSSGRSFEELFAL